MMVGVGWCQMAWRRAWQLAFEDAVILAKKRKRTLFANSGKDWYEQMGSPPIPSTRKWTHEYNSPPDRYWRLVDKLEHEMHKALFAQSMRQVFNEHHATHRDEWKRIFEL